MLVNNKLSTLAKRTPQKRLSGIKGEKRGTRETDGGEKTQMSSGVGARVPRSNLKYT